MIRPVDATDIAQITEMYNMYIRTSLATFEEEEITKEEMSDRVNRIMRKGNPFIVWDENGTIAGYAYASTFRERIAYRFTVESTVYLNPAYYGKGIGDRLYNSLIIHCKQKGYHSMIGVITLPNDPSVKLHEKHGFKKVGHLTESGYKFEQWADVGFWELLL